MISTLPTSILVIVMTVSVAMVGFHDDSSLILIMLRVCSPSWPAHEREASTPSEFRLVRPVAIFEQVVT